MAVIAFVYVHLASLMVKDADYLLKSSRWRFLVPPLEMIRQASVRRQAELRKKVRLNLPSSPVKPISTTDPTPSIPGIWAGLFLSKDGAENVSPPTIQFMSASTYLIGGGNRSCRNRGICDVPPSVCPFELRLICHLGRNLRLFRNHGASFMCSLWRTKKRYSRVVADFASFVTGHYRRRSSRFRRDQKYSIATADHLRIFAPDHRSYRFVSRKGIV